MTRAASRYRRRRSAEYTITAIPHCHRRRVIAMARRRPPGRQFESISSLIRLYHCVIALSSRRVRKKVSFARLPDRWRCFYAAPISRAWRRDIAAAIDYEFERSGTTRPSISGHGLPSSICYFDCLMMPFSASAYYRYCIQHDSRYALPPIIASRRRVVDQLRAH